MLDVKNNIHVMNAWTYAAYLKDLFITSNEEPREQNEIKNENEEKNLIN